jgi:hypothetical protein
VGAEQVAGEVVAEVVELGVRERLAVVPVGDHVLGDGHLLGFRGPSPLEQLAVAAPPLELLGVLIREPDVAEHRVRGQWEGQRVDELGRPRAGQHLADQALGVGPDERLEDRHAPVGEPLRRVDPDASVVRRFVVGHHGQRVEALRQHGPRRVAHREHRVLHDAAGEGLVVAEHRFDVLHA